MRGDIRIQHVAARTEEAVRGKMAASGLQRTAAAGSTFVKPIFSRDLNEAKRRVRELYRAWYREVPNAGERQRRPRGCGGETPKVAAAFASGHRPGWTEATPGAAAGGSSSAGRVVNPAWRRRGKHWLCPGSLPHFQASFGLVPRDFSRSPGGGKRPGLGGGWLW